MTEQFIQERLYLKGVSPKTVVWYGCSFRAFVGAMDNKQTMIQRIAELKGRGTSHITINSYLRCINAYFRWQHVENGKELVKISKLKEEQKVLATFTGDHVRRLMNCKPVGRNQTRVHVLTLTALDSGLRINELLSLSRATTPARVYRHRAPVRGVRPGPSDLSGEVVVDAPESR